MKIENLTRKEVRVIKSILDECDENNLKTVVEKIVSALKDRNSSGCSGILGMHILPEFMRND